MKNFSYQNIAVKILPIIRGTRSQLQLSNQLGYKQNQLHRWETSQRNMNWVSFVELCTLCDIDLKPVLSCYFSYNGSLTDSQAFCKKLLANHPLIMFEKQTGINRNLLSKWLKGESVPTLDNVLRIMDKFHFLLIDFLSSILDISQVNELQEIKECHQMQREVFYNYPVSHGLISLIELKKVTTPEKVAELGSKLFEVEKSDCEKALSGLIKVGIIHSENEELILKSDKIITSGDKIGDINLRKFWLNIALKKMDDIGDFSTVNRYAYAVFSINENDDAKLREILLDCFNKIKVLSANAGDENQKLVSRSLSITDVKIL